MSEPSIEAMLTNVIAQVSAISHATFSNPLDVDATVTPQLVELKFQGIFVSTAEATLSFDADEKLGNANGSNFSSKTLTYGFYPFVGKNLSVTLGYVTTSIRE